MSHLPSNRGFDGGSFLFLGGAGDYFKLARWNGTCVSLQPCVVTSLSLTITAVFFSFQAPRQQHIWRVLHQRFRSSRTRCDRVTSC